MSFDRCALMTLGFVALAALGVPLDGARADYPERQVTLVACFPAGGGTDIAARLINTQLGEALGKPVIIENRAGAGGSIGTAAVARAAPDGYTLLICSSAFVVNPSLYAKIGYDPFKDFVPIMVLGASPNVFVLPPQSKIKDMTEFLALAKQNPGKMNWTSPGAGTTPYLAGELIKQRTGIQMQHIPFAGAGPATNAVLGGQVDLYTANLGSVSTLIESGKVRPVAVTSAKRWPDLPNVPTLEELGIKNAESDTFQGIFAPAGTPKPIIDKIHDAVASIISQPEFVQKNFTNRAIEPAVGPRDEFIKFIADNRAFAARVAKEAKIELK